MSRYFNDDELYHHGILGMHWGKKNGPPYPLGYSDHTAEQKRKNNKNVIDGKAETKASSKKESWKERTEQKYKDKGYSNNAAEIAARNERITKAVLITAGAIAVGVIGYKVATRLGQDYCDKIIKSGATIQNIGGNADDTFTDHRFFAAINNKDKDTYFANFAVERRFKFGDEHVYKNVIQADKDIKRASVNNARKIFLDKMDHDATFKKDVLDSLYGEGGHHIVDKHIGTDKKLRKDVYQEFNRLLGNQGTWKNGVDSRFYDEMKSKGYNAILDINDTRLSGYSKVSKEPTIIFSDALKKVSNVELSDEQIINNQANWNKKYIAKQLAKSTGVKVGAIGGIVTIANNHDVNEYIKEHPNTELSRSEIKQKIEDGELHA